MKIFLSTICFVTLTFNVCIQAQVWELQDPAFPNRATPYTVICPTPEVAWTYGFETDSASLIITEVNYTLSRTTDGGQTWESLTFPHNEPGYFSCLSALNGEVAWIAYVDYSEGNKLLKTMDGGQTWTEQPIEINNWINNVHFFNDTAGVVTGDPDDLGFEIYTTLNGGDSWERVDPNTVPTPLADEIGYSGFYEVVGTDIWLDTNSGRVLYSPDGGVTWSVFTGPEKNPYAMLAVDDEKIVYTSYTVAGNPDGSDPVTQLYRSFDNGISWENITPADNGWWMYDIEPVPGTNTIIASLNASFSTDLYETRISYDRGSTWTTIDNTSFVMEFDFADAESGFAGKWQNANDLSDSQVYNYIGSPLTGLLDPKPLDVEFQVSPNPTSDFLEINVNADVPENYSILLNDLKGNLLYRSENRIDGHLNLEINVSSLPSGTYTLTIASQKGMRTECVIIQ